MRLYLFRVVLSDLYNGGPDIEQLVSLPTNSLEKMENVFVKEYESPFGFQSTVGHGILFQHDWSAEGTTSIIQQWFLDHWENR